MAFLEYFDGQLQILTLQLLSQAAGHQYDICTHRLICNLNALQHS